MNTDICKHTQLTLLPAKKKRIRCRYCHLTISPDELGDGHCPECFESSGRKRYDFDPLEEKADNVTRYRCEACGATVQCE